MEKLLDKEFIETKEPKKRVMKKSFIRKGAMALALALTLSGPAYKKNDDNAYVVEAATRDKKKPKITFKGSKKLTAEEGEAVTIPKTTYSDNVTKKKKLKVGVKVKKGKKSYKTIANKIKKATINNKTTSVKFPEEGTYKITYTVTDLAKNAAVKTRTVVVNDKEEIIEEDTTIKKEDPVTEEPTRTVVTTEQPTTTEAPIVTEQPKTEEPKKEEPIPETPIVDEKITIEDADKALMTPRYADYDIKTVTIGENKYNISHDKKFLEDIIVDYQSDESYECPDFFAGTKLLDIESNYAYLYCDENDRKQLLENYYFLKAFGNISAFDYDNNDISNNVVVFFTAPNEISKYGETEVYIYVEDSYGNRELIENYLKITPMFEEDWSGKDIINSNPYLLGLPHKIKKNKTLVLK